MIIFIGTLALAFVATLAASLPADWAWRRGSGLARAGTVALNVVGIIAIIYVFGRLGWDRGAGDILALVAGIILGGLAGNSLARQAWGRAPYDSCVGPECTQARV